MFLQRWALLLQARPSCSTRSSCRILPVLAVLFLCSFLDRTNVGNAKILGLEKDIGVTNSQYANGLAIFFAFYIAAELPSNLVLKKFSPRLWLAFLTAIWGIVGMCLGFVRNYAGFLIVRAFLGLAEGGLLPGTTIPGQFNLNKANLRRYGSLPLRNVYAR
jgi:MFS family permease